MGKGVTSSLVDHRHSSAQASTVTRNKKCNIGQRSSLCWLLARVPTIIGCVQKQRTTRGTALNEVNNCHHLPLIIDCGLWTKYWRTAWLIVLQRSTSWIRGIIVVEFSVRKMFFVYQKMGVQNMTIANIAKKFEYGNFLLTQSPTYVRFLSQNSRMPSTTNMGHTCSGSHRLPCRDTTGRPIPSSGLVEPVETGCTPSVWVNTQLLSSQYNCDMK